MTKNLKQPVLFLIVFAVFEALLMAFVDRPLAQAVRGLDTTHPALIDFFRAYTDAGLGKWYAAPSGFGFVLCLILYFLPWTNDKWRQRLLAAGQKFVFFFAATSSAGIVTDIIKPLFGRARPKILFSEDFYGFHPITFGFDWNSLPSGHTTTAVSAAAAMIVLFPRLRLPMLTFAFMIGLSRIMVNAHFLSDVLCGAFIGWAVTCGIKLFFARKNLLSVVNLPSSL